MKRYVVLSVLVIIGITSLVSSVFLSQRQTTSTKAVSPCPDGECPSPTHRPNQTPAPTRIATPTPTVTPPADQCEVTDTSNQGCGVYTCPPDTSRQCKCVTDTKTDSLKWSCQCVPDPLCNPPTPTPAPTDVPADTSGLGAGSADQTGVAYCPDGGIIESNGASCDYGRQSAGNSVYIDKDNPNDCAKCVRVNYGGNFPYGQCHYANSSVCRRSDNVGGCAGVCNSTCCSDNSPKENGDDYDQANAPGSSGITSPEPGTGTEEFTFTEDISFSGQPECIDGANYIVDENGDYYPDGTFC